MLVVRDESSDLLSRETVAKMEEKGQAVTSAEVPNAGHAPVFLTDDQIALARTFFLGKDGGAG